MTTYEQALLLIPLLAEHFKALACYRAQPHKPKDGMCHELCAKHAEFSKELGIFHNTTFGWFDNHLDEFFTQRFSATAGERFSRAFPIPHATRSAGAAYGLKNLWDPDYYSEGQTCNREYVILRRQVCGEFADYLLEIRDAMQKAAERKAAADLGEHDPGAGS